MSRQIVLDTETTGLSAIDGDRLIELGCVELVNRKLTGNNLHLYFNAGRDSHPDALRVHGVDNPAARALEALEQVGLPASFAHRFPHELSGGQRQRVGIARAIALRPEFILADEIVSGLDVSSQAQVLNLLERLVADLGLTLAFISHDLSVIRRLCTRVLVLHLGEIVENAPVAQVFSAPQAAYTRELLDAIPLPEPDQVWA